MTLIFLGSLRAMSFVPLPYVDMQAVPGELMTGVLLELMGLMESNFRRDDNRKCSDL